MSFRDIAAMMEMIRADLARLGVEMDVFFSEKSLYGTGRIEARLRTLEDKGLIYTKACWSRPRARRPRIGNRGSRRCSARPPMAMTWIARSRNRTAPGPISRPTSPITSTRSSRGFDQLIDVFGADHGGYVKRMKAAVVGTVPRQPGACSTSSLTQLVKLYKGGEPFKMSKRGGHVCYPPRTLIDECGPRRHPVRHADAQERRAAGFRLSTRSLEQSKDNPVWYVQYAHARINVGPGARQASWPWPATGPTSRCLITDPMELALIREAGQNGRAWSRSRRRSRTSRTAIAFYLYDLAPEPIHALCRTRAKRSPELRFVREDDPAGSDWPHVPR